MPRYRVWNVEDEQGLEPNEIVTLGWTFNEASHEAAAERYARDDDDTPFYDGTTWVVVTEDVETGARQCHKITLKIRVCFDVERVAR